ncbi:hypothetical protein DERF_014779 [Dermatophagoides farinae]|uniref:Uncharacterized protein n=1 Tax=Dermatophagoides farinae TaxID=6954 RepID=A0A922HN10_DERFA|nr:hypothetical protein DERF_014779 [Dermatophagoides farinae]
MTLLSTGGWSICVRMMTDKRVVPLITPILFCLTQTTFWLAGSLIPPLDSRKWRSSSFTLDFCITSVLYS